MNLGLSLAGHVPTKDDTEANPMRCSGCYEGNWGEMRALHAANGAPVL
jgi:hypothetical protein